MWTNALVTAAWVVVAVAASLLTVSVAFWAVQRAADRRRARQRAEAARKDQVTVYDIQRRLDEANRQTLERLSVETAVRRLREEDAELAAADTVTLVGDEPAPLPVPEDDTVVFAAPVPAPRPALRPRPYLDARAAAGRAGTR